MKCVMVFVVFIVGAVAQAKCVNLSGRYVDDPTDVGEIYTISQVGCEKLTVDTAVVYGPHYKDVLVMDGVFRVLKGQFDVIYRKTAFIDDVMIVEALAFKPDGSFTYSERSRVSLDASANIVDEIHDYDADGNVTSSKTQILYRKN